MSPRRLSTTARTAAIGSADSAAFAHRATNSCTLIVMVATLSAGRHLLEQAAEAGNAVASELSRHRPNRRLRRAHHRLLELALPRRNRGHRREIGARHRERVDLRPIDPREGIARVFGSELADGIRVLGRK